MTIARTFRGLCDLFKDELTGLCKLRAALRDNVFFGVFSMLIGDYYASGLGVTSYG